MPISKIIKYEQVLLFIGVGILLWTAIALQLFANDTPCPRCWEMRWVYLAILQVVMISLLFGYKEPLSILVILIFLIGGYITLQQIVTHEINLTKGQAFISGYGGYATFLGLSLTYWNLIIVNLAILYISTMNYLTHRFHVKPYTCGSISSRVATVLWAITPLVVNIYLFLVRTSP